MLARTSPLTDALNSRWTAAGVHLLISLLLAGLAAWLVFVVWYPYPYRDISGGRDLFLIVIAVDVVMGPLMTLAVCNPSKPRRELRRDLSLIGLLQLAALAYGMWTVAVARPVHLVFELDRFRVVHAIDVPADMLAVAPPPYRRLPLLGPTVLSVRDFKDNKESFDATMAALQGVALAARPDLWQPYFQARSQILARAKPLADLKTRFPASQPQIDAALGAAGPMPAAIGYVPMIGRQAFWTVLVDLKTADVVAFVPIDSF